MKVEVEVDMGVPWVDLDHFWLPFVSFLPPDPTSPFSVALAVYLYLYLILLSTIYLPSVTETEYCDSLLLRWSRLPAVVIIPPLTHFPFHFLSWIPTFLSSLPLSFPLHLLSLLQLLLFLSLFTFHYSSTRSDLFFTSPLRHRLKDTTTIITTWRSLDCPAVAGTFKSPSTDHLQLFQPLSTSSLRPYLSTAWLRPSPVFLSAKKKSNDQANASRFQRIFGVLSLAEPVSIPPSLSHSFDL